MKQQGVINNVRRNESIDGGGMMHLYLQRFKLNKITVSGYWRNHKDTSKYNHVIIIFCLVI
jgi:hypothetical protein